MASLLNLPNEILLKITQHLEGKDLANVRLVHSRFAGLEFTRLVQESTIMVRQNDQIKFVKFILGIPFGMNCTLISRLTQLNLIILYSNNHFGAFVEVFSQAERMSSLKIWLGMGIALDLDLDIFPANLTTLRIQSGLRHLSSIHHSAGKLNRLDKLWLQFNKCPTDCAFLQNLPNLSALALFNIEIPRNEWNLVIPAMGNLATVIITLYNYSHQISERLCEEIGKHCHSLTDLRLPINPVCEECFGKLCANYHEGAGVANTFRTSITHLTLRTWPVNPPYAITSASIPHFKNLPNLIQLRFATRHGCNHFPDFEKAFPHQFAECSSETDAFRKF